ncbi:MAG: methyltransferase domain-containing protein, partial [Umezawaea sp.]
MGNYEFDFNDAGPYGSAVRLLSTSAPEGRVVLDIGCGAGAVSAPLAELGATYVGLDLDEESVAALTKRGVEAHVLDLTRPDLREALDKVVNGRRVAAVLCLDVLEHVTDPKSVLEVLANLAAEQADVELVVSVPNVGHVDLARQLLSGHWDMTDSGLLDRTHVRFFTERTLTELMVSTGWYEAAREDFVLIRSDQGRAGHPLFEPKATLGALVDQVRSGADEHGKVNQFVRRYHRGAVRVAAAVEGEEQPFLSVVMRTQGKRPDTLVDVLCCLGAQTDLDFEVLMVVHDSSMVAEVRTVVDQFEGNLAQRVAVLPCDGGTRGR